MDLKPANRVDRDVARMAANNSPHAGTIRHFDGLRDKHLVADSEG